MERKNCIFNAYHGRISLIYRENLILEKFGSRKIFLNRLSLRNE